MSGRVRLLLAAGLLALAGGCAAPPAAGPAPTPPPANAAVTLPAEIVETHFFVVTKWDANGPWRFLIDTGSFATLVSPEFARRYATEEPATDMPSFRVPLADGKDILLPGIKVSHLALGAARFENVTALVYDLSEMSAHFGFKIDGILGFPFFRDRIFTLDYPGARLQIAPAGSIPALPGLVIPFRLDHDRPVITATIGRSTLPILIDSGADGMVHLNPNDTEPRLPTPETHPGATVSTIAGDHPQEIGRLDADFTITGRVFTRPVFELTDLLSTVGGGVLQHFRITFDQRRGLAGFESDGEAPIATGPLRSTGLSFRKLPAYWRVLGVAAGSPADEVGIETGDLVVKIEDQPVGQWSLNRYEDWIRTKATIEYTLLIGGAQTPTRIPIFDLVP